MLAPMSTWLPRKSADGWFRVGRTDVSTTLLAVAVDVVAMLAWVVSPGLQGALALTLPDLLAGDLWRAVTWPLAESLGLFTVLNLFFFWYFGTDLESQIGRRPMARLLLGTWGILTVTALLVGMALPGSLVLAGLGQIEFAIFLVWIAENPRRPLFFNVPAWMFGVVLLAIDALGLLAARLWGNVLALLIGLALVAILARSVGLLTSFAWLPGRRRSRPARPRRQSRSERAEAKVAAKRASDRERLDHLLDRINEQGIGSLSDAERKELSEIRDRLRGPR